MKINKLGRIAAMLCTFALLCGCTDNVNNSGESSTEQSTENSTTQDSTNSSDISSEDSSEVPDYFSSTPEPQPVDIGNGMTLTGTPLDSSELEEFSENIGDNYFTEVELEFIDSLEIPELKDLYKRALRLTWYSLSPIDLDFTSAVLTVLENNRWRPYVLKETDDWPLKYEEMGYTYESFYNEYLRTFTKETVEEMFEEYDVFLDYNGELFSSNGARGGWPADVHWEMELISKSDTVIEFRMLTFHYDREGYPATEYIPEYRNEYDIGVTDFKLVLTEDGWRVANIPVEYRAEL